MTQTPCLNPDCDDLAAPGFSVCRWESCEPYALLDEQGGWLIIHGDGWTQHTADEGTAVDLVLPMVGEDRAAAERMVRHPSHTDGSPRAGIIDAAEVAAVREAREASYRHREASYRHLRRSLGEVGLVGVVVATVAIPCRNSVFGDDDDDAGPTSRGYWPMVAAIARIVVDSAIAADPWEPQVDLAVLRSLVAEDPWVLQRPLEVMERTGHPVPGALPGGLSWGEITRHCATAALEADVLHATRNILFLFAPPERFEDVWTLREIAHGLADADEDEDAPNDDGPTSR